MVAKVSMCSMEVTYTYMCSLRAFIIYNSWETIPLDTAQSQISKKMESMYIVVASYCPY